MNAEARPRAVGLPHAVFLQRVAEDTAAAPEVRLGQGAFLTLRFVDLLAPDREPPAPDVFRYQWAATERYCNELSIEGAAGTEAAHLCGIVRATGEAHRVGDVRALVPALLAYALFLEGEGSLEEAEDVLQSLLHVGGDRLGRTDAVAAWLRLGRVRRLQTEFERADAAYAEAGRIAAAAGDRQSVLLSRVGRSNVVYFRGNLAEAEQTWRGVLADAAAGGYRNVEAQAEHGLGTVLQRQGQMHEGAPHLWRAFELYDDETNKMRALADLGLLLLALGDADGAERALLHVIATDRKGESTGNATIELMHCMSYRRDRLGFERWRARAEEHTAGMPANIRADFRLKVGIGLARFENYRKAETEMRIALEIASAHGLHELEFRIARIRQGLRDCEAMLECGRIAGAEPIERTEALRDVSASLASLVEV
jgi:tetratricopeptide (TPR) repeat protein